MKSLSLYHQSLCSRVPGGPTIDQRFESYYNYCQIFNYILSADTPVDLELPNQWLWEIIDEFIYQFQARVAALFPVQNGLEDLLPLSDSGSS